MRKLLLALLCLLPLLSQADDFIIDETKSDIYFANSILTTKKDAKAYFGSRALARPLRIVI